MQHISVECLYWGVKVQGEGQIVLGQSKGVDKVAENGILACDRLANLVDSKLIRNPETQDSPVAKAYVVQLRYLDDGRALLVTSWMQTTFGRVGCSSLGLVIQRESMDFINEPASLALSMVGRTCPVGDVPALSISVSPRAPNGPDRETPISSAMERSILIELLEKRTNEPAHTAFCSIDAAHLPMTARLADICYRALPKPDRLRGFMTHCPTDGGILNNHELDFVFRLQDQITTGSHVSGTRSLNSVLHSITKPSTLWRVVQAIARLGQPLASTPIELWQTHKIRAALESEDFDSVKQSLKEGVDRKMRLVDMLTPNIIKHLIGRDQLNRAHLPMLIERLCAESAINEDTVPLLWQLCFRVDEGTEHSGRIVRAMEIALGLNTDSPCQKQ